MVTTQLNLKFQDTFLDKVKGYAQKHGYMSIQELIREAVRDKIDADFEVRDRYVEFLKTNKDANTFSSIAKSKQFMDEMRKKAGLE